MNNKFVNKTTAKTKLHITPERESVYAHMHVDMYTLNFFFCVNMCMQNKIYMYMYVDYISKKVFFFFCFVNTKPTHSSHTHTHTLNTLTNFFFLNSLLQYTKKKTNKHYLIVQHRRT